MPLSTYLLLLILFFSCDCTTLTERKANDTIFTGHLSNRENVLFSDVDDCDLRRGHNYSIFRLSRDCTIIFLLKGGIFNTKHGSYLLNQNYDKEMVYFEVSIDVRTVSTAHIYTSFILEMYDEPILSQSMATVSHEFTTFKSVIGIPSISFPVSNEEKIDLKLRIDNEAHDIGQDYVEVRNVEIRYFEQPAKVDFTPTTEIASSTNIRIAEFDSCSLFGHAHAIVLNKLKAHMKRRNLQRAITTCDNEECPFLNSSSADQFESSSGTNDDSGDSTKVASSLPEDEAVGGEVQSVPASPSLRVFCGIYSMESRHMTNIQAQKLTWGHKCTSFLVFSTARDSRIPSVSLPHLGPESYKNMWQKVRSIWKYIHKHYVDEYDYFLLGGDDMYIVMDNLYSFLGSGKVRAERAKGNGMYLGRPFIYEFAGGDTTENPHTILYNTGGPGYILDNIALKKFIAAADDPLCNPNVRGSAEDVYIGMCLHNLPQPILTRDTSDQSGRPRFHFFSPGLLFAPIVNETSQKLYDIYQKADPNMRYGRDCCAEDSIAFHNIPYEEMIQMDRYLHSCDDNRAEEFYAAHGEYYLEEDTRSQLLSRNRGQQ